MNAAGAAASFIGNLERSAPRSLTRETMVDFTDPTTVGYTLLSLGVLLFLLEASMPGFFVGVPATILLILGIFALASPDLDLFTTWAPLVVVVVGIPATATTIWAYRRLAPPDKAPTTQTAENLVGLTGRVTVAVAPDNMRGKVKVQHQIWSATSEDSPIPVEARVRILRVEGVVIVVAPVEEKLKGA